MNNPEENSHEKHKPKDHKPISVVIKNSFKELKETTVAFINAPAALWGVNLPYILEGLVYFGILTILGKFSSENVNLTDIQAGLVYSFLTGGITFAMLLLGGVSDRIGVRKSLLISLSVMLFGRIIIAVSDSVTLANGLWSPMFFMMMSGIVFIVLAYGLYQPAAYAGVKRYTTPQTAAMGYAVIYGLMNLGAFLSGFVSSFTRQGYEEIFPPNGLAAVFWAFVIINILAVLITLILLNRKNDRNAVRNVRASAGQESTSEDEEESAKRKKHNVNNKPLIGYAVAALLFFLLSGFGFGVSFNLYLNLSFIIIDCFFTIFLLLFILSVYEFLRRRPEHPFRDKRFTFFIFILIPVQTLFAHNWLTIPYYLDRAFAGSVVSEYFEVFSNINPVLIFILAPLVAGLTARANVYRMMIIGTTVMALPTFLLVIGPNMYLFLLYILLMTTGEAMWQPRFLQWIAEVAPKGMTGLYMGVGQFPWFLTKVITGFYSGWFLSQYIPLDTLPEDMNSEILWFFYGLIAVITPIGLVLAKKWMIKGFKEKA
jgi:proton-dependent oligopeptide transporter, POT family